MDRERLEELKALRVWIKPVVGPGSVCTINQEAAKLIVSLIDSALAEPSDADVDEAIAMLEAHIKIDKDAIRIRKEIGQTAEEIEQSTPARWLKHNMLILTALRQMKPDLYPKAGLDPDADDWGNGYSRGYADGLQANQKPTDEAVQRAIDDLESSFQHAKMTDDQYVDLPIKTETVALALQGLRQMRSEQPCEICGNFKRIECKADNIEFIAVRCPNCGRLVG